MCGIFGIFSSDGTAINLRTVLRATTVLRHRGPDDEGYLLVHMQAGRTNACGGHDTDPSLNQPNIQIYSDDHFDLAFGFRRLSILDLSPAGHQPMASGDRTCWIVFNGEIYNYIELRNELNGHGYEFRTGTDTEVVLAAYQHWGIDCLKHFTGMWAFALLDVKGRKLILARDRFGIKPFYYLNYGNHFMFASEIKALLEEVASRRVNPSRLYDYLSYGITDYGDKTLFEDIQQLPAAHYMLVPLDKSGQPQARRYWQVDLNQRSKLSFEDAAVQLRQLFLESVKLHLRSDVPVGTALSGGIDSSAIVMAMRHLDERLELHTFSYIADDPRLDEERWVDTVVSTAYSMAHKVKPSSTELVSDLDRLISIQDEPFGSTSIYAQSRVFQLARQAGIKVMLDGQGADEILAGYPYYLVSRIASLLSRIQWLKARRLLKRAASVYESGELKLLLSACGLLFPQNVRRFAKSVAGNGAESGWLNEKWFHREGVTLDRHLKPRSHDFLRGELCDSLVESSLPMLLRYEDRNSMAHSVESRVPFLTQELTEFVLSLPESYLIGPDGTSKWAFRKAMQGIIPQAILDRQDKIGFATPERRWLTALRPWVEQVLNSRVAEEIPAFNLPAMKREWRALQSNSRPFDFRVWRWLNVIRWVERLEVSF
jgi:asparagine synthase (glutamine-hydrolysing)